MRTIDADALKEKAFGKRGGLVHTSDIDDAPTIDAIPVEWLQKYTAVGVAPRGDRLTEGKERLIVHRILNDWQKEQEGERWMT